MVLDTEVGDMARTCEQAIRIGLPAVAFTEHLDHTVWLTDNAPWAKNADSDGILTPAAFDAAGYLAAIERCRGQFPGDLFEVLAHIDYPVRSWPGRFDPVPFEEEFRGALRATARSGRALEINTRLPLHHLILTWWREEGGDAITFGSDAHRPKAVGNGFADAARMAEAPGFRPGRLPYEFWKR